MRIVVMLLLGIAIGAFGAVTLLGAMRQATPLPKGVMAVSAHHFNALRREAESGRCDAPLVAARLRGLRGLADVLDVAFLPTGTDDAKFERHAAFYRDLLDRELTAPPRDCAALAIAVRKVGDGCKACHADFRP